MTRREFIFTLGTIALAEVAVRYSKLFPPVPIYGPRPVPVPEPGGMYPDWELFWDGASALEQSKYYWEVPLFKSCLNELLADDGRVKIHLTEAGKDPLGRWFQPHQGPAELAVGFYVPSGDKTRYGDDIYYYHTKAGAAAEIGHELAHCAQARNLINTINARAELTLNQKMATYYEIYTRALYDQVWEVEAHWAEYSIFNRERVRLNTTDDGANITDFYYEFEDWPEEYNLRLVQEKLASEGGSWKSQEWVNIVAWARGWNKDQLQRVYNQIENYPIIFR